MTRRTRSRLVVLALLPVALAGGGSIARAEEAPIGFIRVAEVSTLLKRGAELHLVDVRSRQEYLARHIRGAVSIPLDTIEARAGEVPRRGLVVLY